MSGTAAETTSDFDALISQLDTLAKAQPTMDDVSKIQAASGEGDDDNDGDEEGDDDNDGDGAPMAKSLKVMGESGEVIEAFDGGELIKSLMASQSAQGEKMAKAMSGVVSIIDKQGQLIKSLVEQVAKLSSQGGGRKSALSVHDRAAGQGSSSGGGGDGVMTTREVLAKAVALHEQGRGGITGHDIAVLETMANRGEQVSEQLVLRIKAAFAS